FRTCRSSTSRRRSPRRSASRSPTRTAVRSSACSRAPRRVANLRGMPGPYQPPAIEIELNPSERSLYERVRSHVADAGKSGRRGLGDLLMLLPAFCVLLSRLLRDDRVAGGDKVVALLGIAYVLSPIDLVPALFFGPLGVLDDLVVVTAAASRIVNHVHPD